ncbi:hypothetical protein BGZ63DRAFT_82454 [Mariannaea sp. PMI_226]|nr:hypothetical protein BGZ63DRAFT_82454 [Mariannaea sp. PMI_226]
MKVIVTGATGVVGKEIVRQCLADVRITKVVILTRRAVSMDVESHPKTEVVMHQDFSKYSEDLLRRLEGASACLWAIGGRSDQLETDKDMLHRVTVEFPLAAATAMSEHIAAKAPVGTKFSFVFCSQKTVEDRHHHNPAKLLFLSSSSSSSDSRRQKGEAEKGLCEIADAHAQVFSAWILRPNAVVTGGEVTPAPKKKRLIGSRSSSGVELTQLGKAFVRVTCEGWKDRIIDNDALLKM